MCIYIYIYICIHIHMFIVNANSYIYIYIYIYVYKQKVTQILGTHRPALVLAEHYAGVVVCFENLFSQCEDKTIYDIEYRLEFLKISGYTYIYIIPN